MYNKELKERFIADFSTNAGRRRQAVMMFDAVAPFEEEYGGDFCTLPTERSKRVVSEVTGLRGQSQKTRLAILREYVRWCISRDVPNACGDLLTVDDFGVDKFRKQMVANPGHLQRYLDCVCAPESEHTIDNTFRCYYWLAYAGMREEDALKVCGNDIDFSLMVVRYDGREYPIYREALPAFKDCVELAAFKVNHPNYTKEVWKDRIFGMEILRGVSEQKSLKAMREEMSRKQSKQKYRDPTTAEDQSLNLRLSYYRAGLSGLYYRMYEAERAGMPPDFMDAAEWFMDGKVYHLEKSRNLIGAKQRQIATDYMNDYVRWKEAFTT